MNWKPWPGRRKSNVRVVRRKETSQNILREPSEKQKMNKELQVHSGQVGARKDLPPPDYTSDEYESKFGRQIELTESQTKRLKSRLKKEIENWKTDTADLHKTLEENNDLLEGVTEETGFPWQGASHLHVPIIGIYMKVFHSVLTRSTMGADEIFYGETNDDALQEFVPAIESALNYSVKNEWNIAQALKSVFWTAPRDGLGILQVPYVEEWETVNDVIYISNPQEFAVEFPSPEESGLDEAEYFDLQMRVMVEASEESPIEIPVTYESLKYRGPKGEVVELADFCIFPATARSISRADSRGHGKRYFLRRGEIRRKKEDGVWIAEKVDELLKKSRSGHTATQFMTSKDKIEGLARSGRSDEYEFFELVYYFALEPGEPETKLFLTYSFEEELLMTHIEFPYRVDFYAFFRIGTRPNRLIGPSIPGDLRDLNDEIDTQHNQRIHTREISTIPSFKGKKNSNKDFEAQADENLFYPGVIFWLDDPEAFDQFRIQPTDLGESMQEERNSMQFCSLVVGIDAFVASGNPQAADPNAPGNKTIALINQSNLRMEDPIAEIREGVEQVGTICLSHMYQFGPAIIESPNMQDDRMSGKSMFPKRILRKGIKTKMQAVTVAQNADAELQKGLQLAGVLVKSEPLIAQSGARRVELWRSALRAGRVPNRNKILPTYEEIMQQEMQMRQQAMQQMAMQQQAEAQKAAQMKEQAMMKSLRDGLAKRRLLEQIKGQAKEKVGAMLVAGGNGNGA